MSVNDFSAGIEGQLTGEGFRNSSSKQHGLHIRLKGALDKVRWQQCLQLMPLYLVDIKKALLPLETYSTNHVEFFDNTNLLHEIDFSQSIYPQQDAIDWIRKNDGEQISPRYFEPDATESLLKIAEDEYWFYGRYQQFYNDEQCYRVFFDCLIKKYFSGADESANDFDAEVYFKNFGDKKKQAGPGANNNAFAYWQHRLAPATSHNVYTKSETTEVNQNKGFHEFLLNADQQYRLYKFLAASGFSIDILTTAALTVYFGKVYNTHSILLGVEQPGYFDFTPSLVPFVTQYNENESIATLLNKTLANFQQDKIQLLPVREKSSHQPNPHQEIFLQALIRKCKDAKLNGNLMDVSVADLKVAYDKAPLEIRWGRDAAAEFSRIEIIHSDYYFEKIEIELIAARLVYILEQFAMDTNIQLSNLSLLSPYEKQLLQNIGQSVVNYPADKNIVTLFEETANSAPNASALVFENNIYTYGEINERANQLAHYLLSLKLPAESLIPLCMSRSAEMIIALLGIMKAGGAYVPIDGEFPQERINYILEDTSARVVIADESNMHLFQSGKIEVINLDNSRQLEQYPTENIGKIILPSQLAYIIYTSGSTGTPKGVMIEHRALLDHCYGVIGNASFSNCQSFALFSPLVFDAGHSLIHAAFIGGACLHVISKAMLADGDQLVNYISRYEIDCIKIVPSLWSSFADDGNLLLAKKVMIFGGESFPMAIFNLLKKAQYNGLVFNHYGPTEATIGKTIHRVDFNKTYTTIPIGKPFSNTRLYVLNKKNEACLIGEAGELHIAGEGLARGYLNLPELTKTKFIPNPFGKGDGQRMYKTGDLAKWLPDGNIEYLGRIDEQVKIRGYRIELGEIETAIQQSGQVVQALVAAVEMQPGLQHLIGYVILKRDCTTESISLFLKNLLPAYMIPTQWVTVSQFSLTINGKIDKKKLPKPEYIFAQSTQEFIKAVTPLQQMLVKSWQRILQLQEVGTNDNFFELGGQSLAAMRLVSAVRRELQLETSVQDVFTHATIETFAKHLESKTKTSSIAIPVATTDAQCTLSFGQEALWFNDQLQGTKDYHLTSIFRIKGALKIDALINAFRELIQHHQPLRTIIHAIDGDPFQELKDATQWSIDIHDLTHLKDDENQLQDLAAGLMNEPFNLAADYMLRAHAFQVKNDECMLVMTIHHIASDGWSSNILIEQLSSLYKKYAGGKSNYELPLLPVNYKDYAHWQRQQLSDLRLEKLLAYWKQKLSDITPLQFPTDYQRSTSQTLDGGVYEFSLDSELTRGVKNISAKTGASLYHTLLAAFNVLLYRYTGQQDISVGSPVAGRSHEDLENLVGYFVNTVVLRNEINANESFLELVQRVKTSTLESLRHQDLPFDKLVENIVAHREKNTNPLFQVMFVYQSQETIKLQLEGLDVAKADHLLQSVSTSKFDFTLIITDTKNGFHLRVEYRKALFIPATIERLVGHFEMLLKGAFNYPSVAVGKLPMLSGKEQAHLVETLNPVQQPGIMYPDIIQQFKAQVTETPDRAALSFQGKTMSYAVLDSNSDQLAAYLLRHGVGRETMVPICIEKGMDMIIGILAVLKAGGAYVPIDPAYPESQRDFILLDLKATLILTNKQNSGLILNENINTIIELDGEWKNDTKPVTDFQQILPTQLAYVIYTSGSTGKPKGVLIEHRSLAASTLIRKHYYGEMGNILLVPSFTFDSSVATIFGSLVTGSTLIILSNQQLKEPGIIGHILASVNTILCVPSYYRFLLEASMVKASALKNVILGGEKLEENLVAAHFSISNDIKLFNEYGPTEGSVWSTVAEIKSATNLVSIGKPINTVNAFITDANMQLLPEGIPGELCIAGVQVARGYLGLHDLTAEKFVLNTIDDTLGNRLYRTGDLVRWLPGGTIEYLGRTDDQVKVNGYRIEPGGIEKLLQECEGVTQAVVIAIDFGNSKKLVAYVKAYNGFDKIAYRQFLKERLPEYMIPSMWVQMEKFPLTANGKINKKALPLPENEVVNGGVISTPASLKEEQLLNIWKRLLAIDHCGVEDNFFAIGGHSLLAMRLSAAIQKEMGFAIPVKKIFENPTISTLALLLKEGNKAQQSVPITPQQRPDCLPLSYNQESLWFIDQAKGSTQYHIPVILGIAGEVNNTALTAAFKIVLEKHEVLRSVIREKNGEGYQQVMPVDGWILSISQSAIQSKDALQTDINTYVDLPFDLAIDFMLRAKLFRQPVKQNVLVIVLHHIAADGWSTGILLQELSNAYNDILQNDIALLTAPALQYADYAIWQRSTSNHQLWVNKIAYWQQQLQHAETLSLPLDYPRPMVQSDRGAISYFNIDDQLYRELIGFSNSENVTLFITLLATFKVLLHRYTGQQDLSVGTPLAARPQQELESLIGYFINPVVIRTKPDGEQSFRDFLQQVKQVTLEAYDNQELPFEKVVEAVLPERNLGRNPLFQVMFALQNVPSAENVLFDGLTIQHENRHVSGHSTSKFDLTFNLKETGNGIQVAVEYCTDLFREQTICSLGEHFTNLLKSIVTTPNEKIGKLHLLKKSEIQHQLYKLNDCKKVFPAASVISMFEMQVQKTPDSIALIDGEKAVTYQQLNRQANQLAHYLQSIQIQPEELVPVCLPRTAELITAMLGILKAGAAYVPIDPSYPADRIAFMLEDISPSILITSGQIAKLLELPASIQVLDISNAGEQLKPFSSHDLQIVKAGNQLAYVIYTSGSTGRPKGVMIEHGGFSNLINWHKTAFDLNAFSRATSMAGVGFDAFGWEVWPYLCCGARLFLISNELRIDPSALVDYINKQQVTHSFIPTAIVPEFIKASQQKMLSLQYVLTGGDKLPVIDAASMAFRLVNNYGPTETCVVATTYEITGEISTAPPIGKSISNTAVYLLNEQQQLVPKGVVGEVYIGGAGVARGYLNRPDLTNAKFVRNAFIPAGKERLYRSGDLARWLPDGNLEYMGRVDQQVKIRGYRIEPGEIENVLSEYPGVQQALVIAPEKNNSKFLFAYLVVTKSFNEKGLQSFLKQSLPEYMIPSGWAVLDQFPLTPNGKINLAALPPVDIVANQQDIFYEAVSLTEINIKKVWCEILNKELISIRDNFFETGGHSLLAMRLVARLRNQLQVDIRVNDLFIYPTISQLAAYLDSKLEQVEDKVKRSSLVPIKKGTKQPLFVVAGGGGTALKFKAFADQLDPDQPVYALQAPVDEMDLQDFPKSIEGIASKFIDDMLAINPGVDFALAGHCMGGIIAFEMSKQLKERGKQVSLLAMFDSVIIEKQFRLKRKRLTFKTGLDKLILKWNFETFLLLNHPKQALVYKFNAVKSLLKKLSPFNNQKRQETVSSNVFEQSAEIYSNALKNYKLKSQQVDVELFYARERYYFTDVNNHIRFRQLKLDDETKKQWEKYAHIASLQHIDGEHSTMFDATHGDRFAGLVQRLLNKIHSKT